MPLCNTMWSLKRAEGLTSANVDVAAAIIRNMGARIDLEKAIRVFMIPRHILISILFMDVCDVLHCTLRNQFPGCKLADPARERNLFSGDRALVMRVRSGKFSI
jgi:hypothetical protein